MDAVKKNLLARGAYRAYGKTTDFKNFQGNPMPEWNNLPEAIQAAWEAAAEQVAVLVVNGFESNLDDALEEGKVDAIKDFDSVKEEAGAPSNDEGAGEEAKTGTEG